MRINEQMLQIVHPKTGESKTLPSRSAHDHVQHLGWKMAEPSDETQEDRQQRQNAHAPRKVKTIEEQVRALKARRHPAVPATVNPGPLVMPEDPDTEQVYARMDAMQDLDPSVDANLPDDPGEPEEETEDAEEVTENA